MNLARLCARLKPVFLSKKGPSRARLLTKMSPSEELGTLRTHIYVIPLKSSLHKYLLSYPSRRPFLNPDSRVLISQSGWRRCCSLWSSFSLLPLWPKMIVYQIPTLLPATTAILPTQPFANSPATEFPRLALNTTKPNVVRLGLT